LSDEVVVESVTSSDIDRVTFIVTASQDPHHPFPVERWGTIDKVIRIVAYVLRFISNLKSPLTERQTGGVCPEEFESANLKLLSLIQRGAYSEEISALAGRGRILSNSPLVQLSPFLDDRGMLRVKGRLQLSDLAYEEKHPLILPRCYVTLLMARFYHKLLKHAGVSTMISSLRAKYWIIGLRRLVKRVKFECLPCKKVDSTACNQEVAPLPRLRVTEAPPFSVTCPFGTDRFLSIG
jgi:hypothetical protein